MAPGKVAEVASPPSRRNEVMLRRTLAKFPLPYPPSQARCSPTQLLLSGNRKSPEGPTGNLPSRSPSSMPTKPLPPPPPLFSPSSSDFWRAVRVVDVVVVAVVVVAVVAVAVVAVAVVVVADVVVAAVVALVVVDVAVVVREREF